MTYFVETLLQSDIDIRYIIRMRCLKKLNTNSRIEREKDRRIDLAIGSCRSRRHVNYGFLIEEALSEPRWKVI